VGGGAFRHDEKHAAGCAQAYASVHNHPVFHKMYTTRENPGLLSTTQSETCPKDV